MSGGGVGEAGSGRGGGSASSRVAADAIAGLRTQRRRFGRWPAGVVVAAGARVAKDVQFAVAPGGRIEIAAGADVGERSVLRAGPQGRILIVGTLGPSCRVVAAAEVVLEAGAALGEEGLLTDTEALVEDSEVPVREQGQRTAPVRVAAGAQLGRGAAVLAGVTVGAGARVLNRSVVTADVPPGIAVAGTPARPAAPVAPAASGPSRRSGPARPTS